MLTKRRDYEGVEIEATGPPFNMHLTRLAYQFTESVRNNGSLTAHPKRPGTSPWIGLGFVLVWSLSRFQSKRRQHLLNRAQEGEKQLSLRSTSLANTKLGKGGGGILSLLRELFAAVAMRLAQRYAEAWGAAVIFQMKSLPAGGNSPALRLQLDGRGP
jgi:hypothetical protein